MSLLFRIFMLGGGAGGVPGVGGATIESTALLTAPQQGIATGAPPLVFMTLLGGGATGVGASPDVSGATIPSTVQLTAPLVAGGTLTFTSPTIGTTAVLRAPSTVWLSIQLVTTASRASTVLLTAPRIDVGNRLSLVPLPAQATLYEPSVDIPVIVPSDGLQDQTTMVGNLGDQTLDWPATLAGAQLR